MLTPRKHLDLDTSVLRVSGLLLREMQKKRSVVDFEMLRALVIRRVGTDGDLTFLPALDLLYLLGKVEYHLKNDTIEFKAD